MTVVHSLIKQVVENAPLHWVQEDDGEEEQRVISPHFQQTAISWNRTEKTVVFFHKIAHKAYNWGKDHRKFIEKLNDTFEVRD